MFYTGEAFPDWKDNIFMCAYNLGRMVRLKLNEDGTKVLGGDMRYELGRARCAADIEAGPDGYIYILDINAMYRLVPTDG
jgi:glucose/arabinose dehydrogenase